MMVSKDLGSWALVQSEPIESDKPLLDMFKRYSSNWYGLVVKIQPRLTARRTADPSRRQTARRIRHIVTVWADH